MQGCSEAGLSEVIGYVLSLFNAEDQMRLAGNVVLTGGLASLRGMRERIQANLTSIRPFQSHSSVEVLANPSLGAWYGMRRFCKEEGFKGRLFSKRDYEEKGPDYFKTHKVSNAYFPVPKGHAVEADT